jgi:hypothetical protein
VRSTLPSWKINQFLPLRTIYRKICNKKVAKTSLKTGLCLELPTQGFISQWVMPENQTPATQPEPNSAPGEFDFAKPVAENPRIKRRSLKVKEAKPKGLTKPVDSVPPAARELEREAPPLSVKQPQEATEETKPKPAAKVAETPVAPARTTSSPAPATAPSQPASSTPTTPASGPATSPHGTRPATLYYSSQPRKAETPSPMKTTPTASTAPSSSATTVPASFTRPATSTSSSRPATTVDYRANVERQSREQKSVGNILAYVVYALIGFFVISAGLAIYGADVIFKQIHDQSVTVSDLDTRYAAANKDLNAKLATTQDTLNQAQAQIARQQDLIVKQQEELNRLIAATNDNTTALKQEKQARTQDTSGLRARVRDLENRGTTTQKF